MRASTPLPCSLRAHAQQAVGIDREGHADARGAGRHRRDAAQLEARQAAAIRDQVALALHHVQRQGGLAVLVGGEVLRLGRGDGLVARHDALDQAAHGLDAQRQRNHVQQQQVAAPGRCRPAGWPGSRRPAPPLRPGFRLVSGSRPKNSATARWTCGMRVEPPTSTTPCTSSLGQLGVAQRLAHGRHGARRQVGRGGFELAARIVTSALRPRQRQLRDGHRLRPRTALPWRRAPPSCIAALSPASAACRPACASTQSASARS